MDIFAPGRSTSHPQPLVYCMELENNWWKQEIRKKMSTLVVPTSARNSLTPIDGFCEGLESPHLAGTFNTNSAITTSYQQ